VHRHTVYVPHDRRTRTNVRLNSTSGAAGAVQTRKSLMEGFAACLRPSAINAPGNAGNNEVTVVPPGSLAVPLS
jgi:hypothetical protein